jgi:hypothetical protein
MSIISSIFVPKEWFRGVLKVGSTSGADSTPESSRNEEYMVRIDRWLRKEGSGVKPDDVIAEASLIDVRTGNPVNEASGGRRLTLRAGHAGILSRVLVPAGQTAPITISATGESLTRLAEVSACEHPMMFGGMCVVCGAYKQQLEMRASVGGHNVDRGIVPVRSARESSILVGKHSIELSGEEAHRQKGDHK